MAASLFVMAFEILRSSEYSMWVDEAISVAVAERSFGSMLHHIWSMDANMGPYYVMLWFWVRLGDGDVWIRALSALATVATIWGIWVVVRRWSGERAAAVAVGVFALSPFVLAWSMQARGYAMAMAFTTWGIVFADRVVRATGRRSGAASACVLGLMIGLAVATQLSTAAVFPGVVIAMVLLDPGRRMVRDLVLVVAVAAGAFGPFLYAVTRHTDQAPWIQELTFESFRSNLLQATAGPLWAVFIASGWVCLTIAWVRRRRFGPELMALAGSVSGILGLALVSILVRPMFVGRYLAGCIPLAVIAAVGGWNALRPRRWSTISTSVATAVIIGFAVVNLGDNLRWTRPRDENFRALAASLEISMRPEDALVMSDAFLEVGVRRYVPEDLPSHRLVRRSSNPDDWFVRAADGRRLRPEQTWFLSYGANRSRGERPIPDWLTREFPSVVSKEDFGLLTLELRQTGDGG